MVLRRIDVAISGLAVLLVVVLYHANARLWWTYDDAFLLHIALSHAALDYFAGTAVWSSMPQHLFTPLLTATYDAEVTLFGLHAQAFYITTAVLLSMLAVTVYLMLRIWFDVLPAAFGCTLFVLGPPFSNLATELMLVHYVESVIFVALAIICFVRASALQQSGRVRESWSVAGVSAALYLLAMLAKEIAVPVVAVLPLAAKGTMRERLRLVWPHVLTLCLYALWRHAALGVWLGGYGWVIRRSDIRNVLTALPQSLYTTFVGSATLAGSLLLIVIGAEVLLAARNRRRILSGLVLAFLSIAPILPMAKKVEVRFLTMPWLVAVIFATSGVGSIVDRRKTFVAAAITLILGATANRQIWASEFRTSSRMSAEARTYFSLGSGDALRKPAVPPAAMNELRWLKEDYLRGKSGAVWFYDDLFLCTSAAAPRHVFGYLPSRRQVIEFRDISTLRNRYCSSIRASAPLTATFTHEGDVLSWSFGPYTDGQYAIVIGNGAQAFDLPRRDSFRLPGVTALTLRVRYASPENWVTYSPDLTLNFSDRADFVWRRGR